MMQGVDTTESQRKTYTVLEAAVRLGVSRNAAYEAVHAGQIPFIRIGKRLLIPKAALDQLLAGKAAA